jgi:creatinine amidohydrolase
MPALRWNELTRADLGETLPGAVVVLPTAATEQHGPHLPTGHDTFIVDEIAQRAADRAGDGIDVVIAPALAFGSSDHHLPFGGTLSLGSETYLHAVMDVLRSIIGAGGRRALVLNGHGGNHELNEIAVRDVALRQPPDRHVAIAAGSWWTLAGEGLLARDELRGVRIPGHAGQLETAMMMAYRPDLVREPRPARDGDPSLGAPISGARVEGAVRWTDFDGYTDSPARATPELGAVLLEIATDAVAGAIAALAATPLTGDERSG